MDSIKSKAIILLVLVSSCAVKNNPSSNKVPVFTGGKWIITEMMGMKVDSAKSGKQPLFIDFNLSDKRMSVYAGCNQMSSGFSVHADTLVIQQMISTRMACPDMEYEYAMERLLVPGNYSFLERENKLTIFHNGSKVLFCVRPK